MKAGFCSNRRSMGSIGMRAATGLGLIRCAAPAGGVPDLERPAHPIPSEPTTKENAMFCFIVRCGAMLLPMSGGRVSPTAFSRRWNGNFKHAHLRNKNTSHQPQPLKHRRPERSRPATGFAGGSTIHLRLSPARPNRLFTHL